MTVEGNSFFLPIPLDRISVLQSFLPRLDPDAGFSFTFFRRAVIDGVAAFPFFFPLVNS